MTFYLYVALACAVGIASNFVPAKWTMFAAVTMVVGAIVVSSMMPLDQLSWNGGRIIWLILFQGTFWYLVPSLAFFAIAFVIGRYATLFWFWISGIDHSRR